MEFPGLSSCLRSYSSSSSELVAHLHAPLARASVVIVFIPQAGVLVICSAWRAVKLHSSWNCMLFILSSRNRVSSAVWASSSVSSTIDNSRVRSTRLPVACWGRCQNTSTAWSKSPPWHYSHLCVPPTAWISALIGELTHFPSSLCVPPTAWVW